MWWLVVFFILFILYRVTYRYVLERLHLLCDHYTNKLESDNIRLQLAITAYTTASTTDEKKIVLREIDTICKDANILYRKCYALYYIVYWFYDPQPMNT
jgi:hypothetical protein